jgi:sulfite exporter TauE/SafE
MSGAVRLLLHTGGGSGVGPSDAGLLVFFAIGLLGGAHCIGMCGPLVTMYSKQLTAATDGRDGILTQYEVRQHALFNLGRTVSYTLLGGLFGLLGGLVFDVSGTVNAVDTPIRAGTGILVGGFILVVGGRYVLGGFGSHGFLGSGPLGRVYGILTTRVEGWVTGPGVIGLGLVHGLLPCPLLYPAFLYAFATGSTVGGALALAALGIGTFPTVFLYGTVVQSVNATHRTRLHRLLGVGFLLMGWMPLAHGLSLYGIHLPHIEPPIYQPLAL